MFNSQMLSIGPVEFFIGFGVFIALVFIFVVVSYSIDKKRIVRKMKDQGILKETDILLSGQFLVLDGYTFEQATSRMGKIWGGVSSTQSGTWQDKTGRGVTIALNREGFTMVISGLSKEKGGIIEYKKEYITEISAIIAHKKIIQVIFDGPDGRPIGFNVWVEEKDKAMKEIRQQEAIDMFSSFKGSGWLKGKELKQAIVDHAFDMLKRDEDYTVVAEVNQAVLVKKDAKWAYFEDLGNGGANAIFTITTDKSTFAFQIKDTELLQIDYDLVNTMYEFK